MKNNVEKYTYGFIGLGLIGASVAKALRRVYKDCTIIGYNRSEKNRELALADGTANIVTNFANYVKTFESLSKHN